MLHSFREHREDYKEKQQQVEQCSVKILAAVDAAEAAVDVLQRAHLLAPCLLGDPLFLFPHALGAFSKRADVAAVFRALIHD
jgi:hypothetical protein